MPEDKKTIVKMAHIYSQEGRWDKAVAEYKKLIELEPEDFNSYSMLGDVYVKKGDFQSAFDTLLICLDAYVRLGQSDKAALALGKLVRLNSDALNPESRRKQDIHRKMSESDAFLAAGNIDKAIEGYSLVLKVDPDRFDLYQKLGDLFLQKGDKKGACAKYREIGGIYLKNRLMKKALPVFQKVLELDSEDADAREALAEIQSKAGNESEAKKELLFLADSLFQRGDFDRTYVVAQKAEQLRATESYSYLGHVELKRGKRPEARSWFEKLLKFKPGHGGALWGMGLVQSAEGHPDDALKTLAKVPKLDRFYGEVLAATAAVEASQGKVPAALEHYGEAVAILTAKGALKQAAAAESERVALGGEPMSAPELAPEIKAASTLLASVDQVPKAPAVEAPVELLSTSMVSGSGLAQEAKAEPVAVPEEPVRPAVPPPEPAEEEGAAALMDLAGNFEAEGSWDEALALYQRVLVLEAGHAAARDGMSRVYRQLAGGLPKASPPLQATSAGPGVGDLAKLAALKAQAEAAQAQARAAEVQRILLERERAEADERARQKEQERLRDETEARLNAEIAALKASHAESQSKSLRASEDAEAMKTRLEAEIRARLEADLVRRAEADAEARRRSDEEARMRAEAEAKRRVSEEARAKAEAEAKRKAADDAHHLEQKRQTEVLARVQAQQKERLEPLRRTLDEMRKKVGEHVVPETLTPPKKATAAHPPLAREDEDGGVEDFMTATVADIYVKQGLKQEAQKIYERILTREPGNAEVRAKLDALVGHDTAASTDIRPSKAPTSKKSKVSYL